MCIVAPHVHNYKKKCKRVCKTGCTPKDYKNLLEGCVTLHSLQSIQIFWGCHWFIITCEVRDICEKLRHADEP